MTNSLSFSLFNSLTRSKQQFTPIRAGEIGLYVCGVTVYDHCHLGHARVMLFFDLMTRFLRQNGWSIRYVRNITDVDDKIVERARGNDEEIDSLTARVIASMHQDLKALRLEIPSVEPRATAYMDDIIVFISRLLDAGAAYVTELGNVYFSVAKHENYGKLSGKKLDDLLSGVRIDVEQDKRAVEDFALWKAIDQVPYWAVPWGDKKGRPGWHIECSAMAKACLGDEFDIHGGGPDLVFPHHENEIAQSETANQCQFAHHWMHVGSLQVDDKKMSKSLGNFITIKQALHDYTPEEIRYAMFSSYYRSPLNYTSDLLLQSRQSLANLRKALRLTDIYETPQVLPDFLKQHNFYKEWIAAMTDDFNTPKAFAVLFAIAKAISKSTHIEERNNLAMIFLWCAAPLGIIPDNFKTNNDTAQHRISASDVEANILLRKEARENKNWQLADDIRAMLDAKGVSIKDNSDGSTSWTRDA